MTGARAAEIVKHVGTLFKDQSPEIALKWAMSLDGDECETACAGFLAASFGELAAINRQKQAQSEFMASRRLKLETAVLGG